MQPKSALHKSYTDPAGGVSLKVGVGAGVGVGVAGGVGVGKAHMNIQNIPYKGVDYTKENYDESFPLLGCLHDQ